MRAIIFTISLIALARLCPAQQDAASIVRRSVEANARDWKAAPEYDCLERDQQPRGGTKTYEDLMILGTPYQRLVSENGKPLSPARQAEEQSKLDTAIVERTDESDSERASRIAKYEKERKRDQLLMEQLARAMDFTLVSQQRLYGYDVYVLKAMPRADYRPPNMESEVLRGMQGRLWIDKHTFQWVKVEAQVIQPVSIEGFLAQVQPGTRFELEKMPVEDDIWLPKHFSMKAHAKILFLFPRTSQEDDTYFEYRKATRLPTTARQN